MKKMVRTSHNRLLNLRTHLGVCKIQSSGAAPSIQRLLCNLRCIGWPRFGQDSVHGSRWNTSQARYLLHRHSNPPVHVVENFTDTVRCSCAARHRSGQGAGADGVWRVATVDDSGLCRAVRTHTSISVTSATVVAAPMYAHTPIPTPQQLALPLINRLSSSFA